MSRKVLCAAFLIALLTPAWAKISIEVSSVRQPSTVFIVGPGTIVSVHRMDVPFIGPRYAIKYKVDDGDLIELWTPPGKNLVMLEGMHGILTYSVHPESIIGFRQVGQKSSN